MSPSLVLGGWSVTLRVAALLRYAQPAQPPPCPTKCLVFIECTPYHLIKLEGVEMKLPAGPGSKVHWGPAVTAWTALN